MRPRPAAAAHVAELVIDSVGARGDGVARLEGKEVFMPLTLPGERIRARVSGERGVIEAIIEPSAERRDAPCRHFGDCGGCALQHASPSFYRGWKRGLVIDALTRAGFRDPPVRALARIEPATRRRATFAVARSGQGAAIGFNARGAHRLIAIEACDILHPALFAGLPALRRLVSALPGDWRAFDLAVTLCENGLDADIQPAKGVSELEGPALARIGEAMAAGRIVRLSVDGDPLLTLEPPVVRFGGAPVRPPTGGFLQASAEGEAELVAIALAATAGARRIADLFCGSGAFAIPLSRTATVFAADEDRAAIAALDAAARASGFRPIATDARNLFERPIMAADLNDFDAVVFDPPRAGARAQAEEIARADVRTVVAVSCNPATFARDAARLAAGGYGLIEVTPVDQFVYSPHVELAAVFAKR